MILRFVHSLSVFSLVSCIFPNSDQNYERILQQLQYQTSDADPKIHRIYLDNWNEHDGPIPVMGEAEFHVNKCKVSNCVLTNERAEQSDAIIMRNQINPRLVFSNWRRNEQIFIWHSLESPVTSSKWTRDYDDVINWTATYRPDSHISTPYGLWVPKDKVPPDQVKPLGHKDMFAVGANETGFLRGRSPTAAWLVSACQSRSGREHLVREMQRGGLVVDIMGSCGRPAPSPAELSNLLNHKHSFYLAFENSRCRHYVTEKLLGTAFRQRIVPVVFGASESDYETIAPPNSFVRADPFKDAKGLIAHLRELTNNETLYDSYFQWRANYRPVDTKFWCRVCAMMSHARINRIYDHVDNLHKWWTHDQCNEDRGIWPGQW